MGRSFDGTEIKSAFYPNDSITLAEVATSLSRLLRGETYKGSEKWRYQNHLLALQKAGIIPRNVNPSQNETKGEMFTMLSLLYTHYIHFIQ
jgi:hypothetical protein